MDFDDDFAIMFEDAGVGKKTGTARLRRSCEVCRGTKGKCVPSVENSARCQRFV